MAASRFAHPAHGFAPALGAAVPVLKVVLLLRDPIKLIAAVLLELGMADSDGWSS